MASGLIISRCGLESMVGRRCFLLELTIILIVGFSMLLGCHYDNKTLHFLPDANHHVSYTNENKWCEVTFVEDANHTVFLLENAAGSIPGKLGAAEYIVFSVPSDLLKSDSIIPIADTEMWVLGEPYFPGYRLTDGELMIKKVRADKIVLKIDNAYIHDIFRGWQTCRRDKDGKLFDRRIETPLRQQ